MYIDSFSSSYLAGCDSLGEDFGGRFGNLLTRRAGQLVSDKYKPRNGVRRRGARRHQTAGAKARAAVHMRPMNRHGAFRGAPALNGDGFLLSSPQVYLRGDELGGWLTDLTKPVSKVVRGTSSAVLGIGRTGIRATAPALVSALTGRPVNVGTGGGQDGGGAGLSAPPDRTLLYVGLGAAGLLSLALFAKRK